MGFPWHPALSVLYIRRTPLVGFLATGPRSLDLLVTKRTLIIKHLGAGSHFIKGTALSETIARIYRRMAAAFKCQSPRSLITTFPSEDFSSKGLARMLVVQGLYKHGSCAVN